MRLGNSEDGDNMSATIITVGNGGFNIASDIREAGILTDAKLIVCDTDADDLERNSASADCSFLFDGSIPALLPQYRHLVKPIVEEITGSLYIVSALGGKTSDIYTSLLAIKADSFRRFVWNIITMPAAHEGSGTRERAIRTRQYLWMCADMFLVQDNNKLSTIPELSIGNMNEPIVNTLAIASLFDMRRSINYNKDYTEYIPEKYRSVVSMYKNIFKYPTI